MCFFGKKLKVEEVYNYFRSQAVNKRILGFENGAWKLGNTLCGKKLCYVRMVTRYKKWDMQCEFYYNKEKKEIQMEVVIKNLPLGGMDPSARNLQKAIDKRFKDLSILYRSSETLITITQPACKKIEELDKVVSAAVSKWNYSEFITFADVNFKTTEELKRK